MCGIVFMVVKILINPYPAECIYGNMNMNSTFLLFRNTKVAHVGKMLVKSNDPLFYTVNTMSADVLATSGARASATMVLI